MNTDAPRSLLVVGAAAGMGRWLVEHLLSVQAGDQLVLVDTESALAPLEQLQPDGPGTPQKVLVTDGPGGVQLTDLGTGSSAELSLLDARVCLAVPLAAIEPISAWLRPRLGPQATVCGVGERQGAILDEIRRRFPDQAVYGLHALFDSSTRSTDGQTFVVIPDEQRPDAAAHSWLTELIAASGGIAQIVPASDHDRTMAYIQGMTHQVLLAFMAAVTSSGLDLEHLWELRTPLFESLFGLGSRVLGERQQATVAEIQLSMDGSRITQEIDEALTGLHAAVATGKVPDIEAAIAAVRSRFSGSLFDTVQATAKSAVTASQATRAELAKHRRLATLVGIRPLGRPDALRVGRIETVTPVSVTLREEMIGRQGQAALLDSDGRRNAARAGMSGKARRTNFGLGHVELVLGDELDHELDRWLAAIRRDIRFLVPESVAGRGVHTIIANHPGIRDAELVSEVVRTGQRSVVVRVWIRADYDVEDMVEELRARVQDTYVWPQGISFAAPGVEQVHYLGPAGTFSEGAARQAIQSASLDGADALAHDDFPAVLAALDQTSLAILPISSSASGLVTHSARALLQHPGDLVAGGVVDVAVRLDAYIQADRQLDDLRGARVYSHPQALGQCVAFIRRWGLEPVPCLSTTEALERVAQDSQGSVGLARASASIGASLKVAEREVDDLSGSITRFLILGQPSCFGTLMGGWDPTLRHIWVTDDIRGLMASIDLREPGFDEFLTAQDGLGLWITSRQQADLARPGIRYLGRAPWSPRTPVVRVDAGLSAG